MFTRRSGRESNSVTLPTKKVCCRNTCRPASWESSRQDSNLRYPVRETGVFAARRRDEIRASSTGGSRTHRHQALDQAALPVSVPCHEYRQLRVGSRTSASERMKLGRAPAHPQSQAPVSSRARRAYEARPGTCPPGGSSRRGEDSNSHASGARASEARASTIPPPGASFSGPCGDRTRLSSLRG